MKCPQCGADLEVDPNRKIVYCNYCGSKIFIDATFYHIVRFKNDYLQARYLNFNTVEINDLELIEVCEKKQFSKKKLDFN